MRPTTEEGEALRREAVDWLMRLQASPRDATVRAGLDAWLAEGEDRRRAWRSVERVWRLSGGLSAADAPSAAKVTPLRARRRRPAIGIVLVALAACVMLYVAPVLTLRLQADHVTRTAELRDVTLEDGTVVHLDAGSAIAIRYGTVRREVVLLAGRAFFEVVAARDRPFVVLADDVTVTVTGTAFDVHATDDGVVVSVQSGTVDVGVGGSSIANALTRGESLSVSHGIHRIKRSEISPQDVASWRSHRLIVDGATLAEVIEELERHHAGFIVLRDRSLGHRRVTGVFDLRRPVEALDAIARSQHGSVTAITPYVLLVSADSRPREN